MPTELEPAATTDSDGPPRAVLIAALAIAVVAVGVVLGLAATRRTPTQPVAIASIPAPHAESADCQRLLDTLPKVRYYTMGMNKWQTADSWPPKGTEKRTFYTGKGGTLSTAAPDSKEPAFDDYVSDPAKPVPSTETIAPMRTASRTLLPRRAICSASLMACDPGRVDSAPMSMRSAPSRSMASTRARAFSSSANSPPSENESGVRLSTPMITTRMRAASSVRKGDISCG